MNMNRNRKGFTLIELLVVIAIIGILATISLVSLNSSTQAADDGKIKVEVAQIKALALNSYIQTNSSYDSVCLTTGSIYGILNTTGYAFVGNGATLAASNKFVCNDNASAYVAAKSLSTPVNGYFCVDSTGFSGVITGAGTNATSTDLTCALLD